MPEIIVYTNDGDCANGVAEIQPFTTGDATNEWTIKFNNGTDFYEVEDVTMRVGHVNGLPDGSYTSAFKWSDRKGTESIANITVTAGVPSVTFTPSPAGGLVGEYGVYILRGPQLDGAITSIQVLNTGSFDTLGGYASTPVLEIDRTRAGSYYAGVGSGAGGTGTGTIFDTLPAAYSNSPSGTSFALATANLGTETSDLNSLINSAAVFQGSTTTGFIELPKLSLGIYSSLKLTGDMSISFKMVKFTPLGAAAQGVFSGVSNPVNNPYNATFSLQSTSLGWNALLSNVPNITNPSLNGFNQNLIEGNQEYDYVLSRSGSTWTITASRNGTLVTSGSGTGWTNDVPIDRIGASLGGIIREVTFKEGSTIKAAYEGAGNDLSDWADSTNTYNATSVGALQLYTGGGGGRNVSSVTLVSPGSGFPFAPIVALNSAGTTRFTSAATSTAATLPTFKAFGNWAEYKFPFMRAESGNDIIAATTLSPYSDGDIEDESIFNHSTLVVRPETIATASLTESGTGSTSKWTGTMNPINDYTTERLSLRNSTQLDLQIRGDGRTLFQGQLTILNKIS